MNTKVLFNDKWEFAKSTLETTSSDGLAFNAVDIPHDWLIYNTLNLYEDSTGWYRKEFTWHKNESEVLLSFDGVYMDSTLYINRKLMGEWKYGYSSFEYEITDALIDGKNEILVKVVHQSPNSRWYSGAGIYRNVWLKTRDKNHIATNGIYVATQQNGINWKIDIDTELFTCRDAWISHKLLFQNRVIADTKVSLVESGQGIHNQQTLMVKNPLLWSTDEPSLYQLMTELLIEKEGTGLTLIETVSQNLGFRNIVFDPDRGLELNGKLLKLNGVCEHHDLGALGSAFNKTALRRRLTILKEMGVNAIRTSHNMPATEFVDLADEMGFLIDSEAFDMWERAKNSYDYARFFPDWFQKDVKSWVMRDRNHPSLLMWSIGNEIYDTHAGARGQELLKMLIGCVLKYDPKQNGKVTFGSNYMPWENTQRCADIIKIPGYNYCEKYYRKHHQEHPDWIIYGSETASTTQSRGVYHFPLEKSILGDDDEQCSSLGNSSTSWGAKSTEACICADRDAPFSLGQFIWSGFDYIGEPTPYHTKSSYFGQIDTATFPKDSYYIYQAEWTDYKTNPMVHIFPYWDFSEGQMIDVRICSNAPKIELQFNGSVVGTHEIDHEHGTELVGCWKIPYKKGKLKALAYDESGKIIATDSKSSFGDAKQICLHPDKQTLVANGSDLIFAEIFMRDELGNPVENANNRVSVQVTGAGRLLGLDNGDSADYDSYKGMSRRLFGGKLMAIIGATKEPGIIRLEVSSKGMESQTVEFEALPTVDKALKGVSAFIKNTTVPCIMGSIGEIPLRKIEIASDSGQLFDRARKEIKLQARLHPKNTSYSEIEWSVVSDGGIPSNIAKVDASGPEAKVTALSDGNFRIRCTSKNGTDNTKLISELDCKVTGLGSAYKDPYGFVAGGLYDYSKGELTNGNERGVATARDGETQVGFRDIDFGPYGSNIITLPIFALSNDKYPIEIWEGMPDEAGSSLIDTVFYQKESKWNTYQEETYKLSKRLCGVTSICFVLRQKVHIKGFSFERKNRAFEQNMATESNHIYGDSYQIKENGVERIGNNVSLVFENMEFAAEGSAKIEIYGRSNIDKNTIHIRFSNQDGSINQIVEFTHSEEYEKQVFELEKVTGIQNVTFIFLPGCDFDFGWFRFEK